MALSRLELSFSFSFLLEFFFMVEPDERPFGSEPYSLRQPQPPASHHPTKPIAIKGILIPVEPKRQDVPRSHLLFDLVVRGKPYLVRGEGCP